MSMTMPQAVDLLELGPGIDVRLINNANDARLPGNFIIVQRSVLQRILNDLQLLLETSPSADGLPQIETGQQGQIQTIQRVVADYFQIHSARMVSRNRTELIVWPRQVAMYLCREFTEATLEAIGNAFQRDHTTVKHALKAVLNRMHTSTKFSTQIIEISNKLQEALH